MFKRLCIHILFGLLLLSACAKPPVPQMDEARDLVARAYASGAATLAPDAYRLASDALRRAEENYLANDYEDAEAELALCKSGYGFDGTKKTGA